MRTTLDLDDAVLSVARAKAKADGISLGRAVSELARRGITAPSAADTPRLSEEAGFPILRGVETHPVTDELVAEYSEDS